MIVIGGGVAGTAAALGLRQAGLTVCLIEAGPAPRWKIGETLAPEARPLLQALGLWQTHLQAGHLPSFGNLSSWGWDAVVAKDFIGNPHGHAWQLDRTVFEATLTAAARESGVDLRNGTTVTGILRRADHWTVQAGPEALRSPWLIDASGRRAMVARHLGIRRPALDSLVSIHAVASSAAATDRDARTLIESLPDGWGYTALTPGGRRTVSFQTDAGLLPPDQSWRAPGWFTAKIRQTRHLSSLLEKQGYAFDLDSGPCLTSAHSGRLENFSGPGWLAIGDAAMSFDPITGQGLLKALQSASQATQIIANPDPEAWGTFNHWNENLWTAYLAGRQACYQMERRWPASPFWREQSQPLTSSR